MIGGILKLTLFVNVVFLFIIILCQTTITDASPTIGFVDKLAKSNDDISDLSNNNNNKGAIVVKRSLHSPSPVDQQTLIDISPIRSRTRHRRLRKKIHSNKLKHLSNIFQSTGTHTNNKQRSSKRIQTVVDDRLKRFRMLDPDEFQEMLFSLSQQKPTEHINNFNSMEAIDGMQLENYWSRK